MGAGREVRLGGSWKAQGGVRLYGALEIISRFCHLFKRPWETLFIFMCVFPRRLNKVSV